MISGTVSSSVMVYTGDGKADSGRISPPHAASRPPLLPFPTNATLRRVCPWQSYPFEGENLSRVAIHEAGHVVFLEWLGVTNVTATATAQRGEVRLVEPLNPEAEASPFARPDLAATAAAIFHSGTCAELLAYGVVWHGPVWRPMQQDHKNAELLLAPVFGAHASGAHAYAQRAALHVLSHRWDRVCEVAQELERTPGVSVSLPELA